ncbi:structural constituent of nuclear pore protein [Ceratobasidium sp. AG-Ba]|nr:structural constituent of nuclear pore protein [Ceratobasidium sp. AG-Ba]
MDNEYWLNLNTFLTNAFLPPTRQYEQELYYRLGRPKSRFYHSWMFPPRSSAEETELKSGKATIGGQQKTYNNDFIQQALFLAILSGYPTDDPVDSAVKAVDQFHACRRHALDTLRLVLESAMGMHQVEADVRTRLTAYAVELVGLSQTLATVAGLLWPEDLLATTRQEFDVAQKQQANQRNADSSTVIGINNVYSLARTFTPLV